MLILQSGFFYFVLISLKITSIIEDRKATWIINIITKDKSTGSCAVEK